MKDPRLTAMPALVPGDSRFLGLGSYNHKASHAKTGAWHEPRGRSLPSLLRRLRNADRHAAAISRRLSLNMACN